jgi:hypothetical protein
MHATASCATGAPVQLKVFQQLVYIYVCLDIIEITHDPLLFSVAQGIFCLSSERLSRSTLHLIEGGERGVCTLALCSLANVTVSIDPSVKIVTKSPKVVLLLIFSISLCFKGERYECFKPRKIGT